MENKLIWSVRDSDTEACLELAKGNGCSARLVHKGEGYAKLALFGDLETIVDLIASYD